MKQRLAKYKKIVQWVLTLLCAGYIVSYFMRNADDLKVLGNVRPATIGAMAAVYLVGQFLSCYRLRLVLETCSGEKLPFVKWFKVFILGQFLNNVVPQAGNVYRSMTLKRDHSISYTNYIAGFFCFTWMHICMNLIFALIIVSITAPDFTIGTYKALHLLIGLIVCGVSGPIVLRFVLPAGRTSTSAFSWTRNRFAEVLHISVRNLTDIPYMTKFLISGVLVYANAMFLFYLSFSAFDADVSFAPLALFMVVLTLSNRIIITPGNIGMREIAFGIASEQMNIGMAEGILVSALIRVVGLIFITCLGMIFGGIDLLRNKADKTDG